MSISIDYIFNRVYDVLLWFKYTWLFTILRTEPEKYVRDVEYRDWDGLRDRGWFDEYFAAKSAAVPESGSHVSMWQRLLESTGYKLPDSDLDGIPDVTDTNKYDSNNLTKAELKERFEADYTFSDHVRDTFGIGPKDTDKDGVPDSYEISHKMNARHPDSDRDGVYDGQELADGTDPLNSDTDGDLVLDGRDEAPLDVNTSSIGKDTDGDGLSDRVEGYLLTSSTKKDTDGDNIPDNMDTYPNDPENISQIATIDFSKNSDGIHFTVQNPVLALVADLMSILLLVGMCIFAYVVIRWVLTFLESMNHFEHHFHHDDHHSHGVHIIKDTTVGDANTSPQSEMPAGIAGLPIATSDHVASPTLQELKDHPKFAVIQGYLSSQSEALWRIGIMEADNLLGEALREKGYRGDGVGEMLKMASFKTVQLAWDAHKVRNRIAHDGSSFQLTPHEAKRVFNLYESVLRELKVIL
jgi:hypothetical protein